MTQFNQPLFAASSLASRSFDNSLWSTYTVQAAITVSTYYNYRRPNFAMLRGISMTQYMIPCVNSIYHYLSQTPPDYRSTRDSRCHMRNGMKILTGHISTMLRSKTGLHTLTLTFLQLSQTSMKRKDLWEVFLLTRCLVFVTVSSLDGMYGSYVTHCLQKYFGKETVVTLSAMESQCHQNTHWLTHRQQWNWTNTKNKPKLN